MLKMATVLMFNRCDAYNVHHHHLSATYIAVPKTRSQVWQKKQTKTKQNQNKQKLPQMSV